MRAVLAIGLAVAMVMLPSPLHAWGMDVHRALTRRAIDGLPAEVKPFLASQRDFIVEHAADPDLWHIVGLKSDAGDEDPNHFFNIDQLDERAPFTHVPRTWDGMVARYGRERALKAGRLPWRTQEIYDRLVTALRDAGRPGGPPYARGDAVYLAAVLAHYIEDANEPFHVTGNYDGQLSNQRGIHARFETTLVLRNWADLALAPVAIRPLGGVRDFVFRCAVENQALVAPILRGDRQAAGGREFYDDTYFAAFLADVRPLLEARLSEASSAVASVIVEAWEQAGRPALGPDGPRPPARIRR